MSIATPGRLRPTLALVLASLLWGLSWLPLKALAGAGVEGLTLVLLASGAAGLATLPAAWRRRASGRVDAVALLAIAVLGGYANLSFALALIHGEVVRVMVLFYLLPVWGALGGRLFLREALTPLRGVTVALAVAGAFLTLGGPAALDAPLSGADLLALSCGLAFALNNLVFRARAQASLASKVSAMQLGSAGLALLAIAGGLGPAGPAEAGAVAWTIVYGLGWLLLATLGTQWGVSHLPAARASVIITLELVAAALSATLLGVESWTPGSATGVALILAATLLEGSAEDAPRAQGARPAKDP
jgi:drug/metabolite transporter (DMT)-like permease